MSDPVLLMFGAPADRESSDWVELVRQEAKTHKLPLKRVIPKRERDVPESYVLDVVVGKAGETVEVEYFYVIHDVEIEHFLEWRRELRILGYDLETSDINPMDGDIATIQLGNPICSVPRAYVFDVRCLSAASLAKLHDILTDPTVAKLGQNVKFECKWSLYHWGTQVRNVVDTQVTELILRAGLWSSKAQKNQERGGERKAYTYTSMAALTFRYLGIDIDKDHDLRTSFFKTPAGTHSLRQIVYAASDVIYPFYIAQQQRVHIEARKLRSIAKIEYQLIPVLADMELTGIRMDTRRWRILWQEAVQGRATAEAELDRLLLSHQGDLFGGTNSDVRPIYMGGKKPVPINYSSSAQVKWAIRQYCEATNWSHKIVTSMLELDRLKKLATTEYSQGEAPWVDRAREWLSQRPVKTYKDLPDYFIPEDRYCILVTADKNALILAKCRGQLPAAIVDPLLEYSKFDIRCDTFGNEFLRKHLRKETGCVHTEFHQAITVTGRLSSSPNLQNIPNDPRYRRCFIPKPGYVFVTCDFSQVEPRITAQISGDENYTRTFLEDDDLYLAVAEAMLGYRPNIYADDPTERKKAELERAIFKTVVLALAYSMGPHKLRDRLTIALHKPIMAGIVPAPTFEYAKELYDRFFEVHAKVREYQKKAVEWALPTHRKYHDAKSFDSAHDTWTEVPNPRRIWDDFLGAEVTWVTAPCGRKRFFPPEARSAWTEGPNVGPQAGSATITKAAAVMLQNLIDRDGLDAHLINLVHDEIVVEVRKDQAEAFAVEMKRLLEKAGQFYCPDIPIKADFPKGTSGLTNYWAKAVEDGDEDDDQDLPYAA